MPVGIKLEDIAPIAMPHAKRGSPALRLARDTVSELAIFLEGNNRSNDPFQKTRNSLVEYFRERFERLGVQAGDIKHLEARYPVAQRGARTYIIGATGSSARAFRYTNIQMQKRKELLLPGEIASPTVTLVRPDILDATSSRLSVVQLPPAQQGVMQEVISCTDGLLLDTGVAGDIDVLNKGRALCVNGEKRLRTITTADLRDLENISGGEVADVRTRIQEAVSGLFITEFHSARSGLNVTDADGFRSK